VPPVVVLVTGVSRWLGGALAAELARDRAIQRVIGVDTVPPSPEMLRRLGRTEFLTKSRAPLEEVESRALDLLGKLITGGSASAETHPDRG